MAEYDVKVHIPASPVGERIKIHEIGVFENGAVTTLELSEEQVEALGNAYGFTVSQGNQVISDYSHEKYVEQYYTPTALEPELTESPVTLVPTPPGTPEGGESQ